MEWTSYLDTDIVAQDREAHVALAVEVETRPADRESLWRMDSALRAGSVAIPFAMLVYPDTIRVFQGNGRNLSGPVCSLQTAEVLRHYDPEVGHKRIFHDYFCALVEAWLRDLAYHWKSETPPGSELLAAIGLLQRLEGGTTRSEVNRSGDTLR